MLIPGHFGKTREWLSTGTQPVPVAAPKPSSEWRNARRSRDAALSVHSSLKRVGNAENPQPALFPWQQEDASKRTKFETLPQMSWDFVFVTRLYIIISCGYNFNRFLNFLQMFYRFIFTSLWCKKNQQNKLEEVKKKKKKAKSWESNVSASLISSSRSSGCICLEAPDLHIHVP